MEVEDDTAPDYDEEELLVNEQEVEAMIGIDESEVDEEEQDEVAPLPTVSTKLPHVWPEVPTERAQKYKKEIQSVRERFEDNVDVYDTTMVSEYAEEIFEYMCNLEVCSEPWAASWIMD
jgi:molecular chaperone GrpE (heat shock protein)